MPWNSLKNPSGPKQSGRQSSSRQGASSSLQRLIRLVAEEPGVHAFIHQATADHGIVEEARALTRTLLQGQEMSGQCRELCERFGVEEGLLRARLWAVASLFPGPVGTAQGPYDILGVEPWADQETIKRAFRKLCLQWHPDLNHEHPEAVTRFQQIKAAYDMVSEPEHQAGLTPSSSAGVWQEDGPREVPSPSAWNRMRLLMPLGGVVVLLILAVGFADLLAPRSRPKSVARSTVTGPQSPPTNASLSVAVAVAPRFDESGDVHLYVHPIVSKPEAAEVNATLPREPVPEPVQEPSEVAVARAADAPTPQIQGLESVPEADILLRSESVRDVEIIVAAKPVRATEVDVAAKPVRDVVVIAAARPVQPAPARTVTPGKKLADRAGSQSPIAHPERLAPSHNPEPAVAASSPGPVASARARSGNAVTADRKIAPRPGAGTGEASGAAATAIPSVARPQTPTVQEGRSQDREGDSNRSVVDVSVIEQRLEAFLREYSTDYSRRDLPAFMRHFTPQALENNKPLRTLLPLYEENFRTIPSMQYHIEPERWLARGEGLHVEGRFHLLGVFANGQPLSSRGRLNMDLVPDGTTYRVQSLNYSFN